jgi:mono/diheme cytochrome c family protein
VSGALWLSVAPALILGACSTDQTIVQPDPHLERMLDQPKRLPYGEDPYMPNGMTMMHPPEGAVPTTAVYEPAALTGMVEGGYVTTLPPTIDRAALERGRRTFEVVCAVCHGIVGDGVSVVAEKMARRKPPNLHEPRIVAYPPGRVFRAIREGYGFMPSYAVQIDPPDAWAVVGYVEALQLARAARVSDLPPEVRAELETRAAPTPGGARPGESP